MGRNEVSLNVSLTERQQKRETRPLFFTEPPFVDIEKRQALLTFCKKPIRLQLKSFFILSSIPSLVYQLSNPDIKNSITRSSLTIAYAAHCQQEARLDRWRNNYLHGFHKNVVVLNRISVYFCESNYFVISSELPFYRNELPYPFCDEIKHDGRKSLAVT
uniref:Uncharacterized protein n=1 Tax=Heterorhabditis bacteriophora TaxID=37862 RepID=A0A1I7X2M2_HETBA